MDQPPLVRIVIVVAGLAGISWLALDPAYQGYRKWKVGRDFAAARASLQEGRMEEARDFSLLVARADKEGTPGIEVVRILGQSMESLRDPRLAAVARALVTHPEGSTQDRLKGFQTLAAQAPLALVGQAWSSLPESERKTGPFAVAFADRLLDSHRLTEAAEVLLAVPEPDWRPELERHLIRVLILRDKAVAFAEAQRWISRRWPAAGESPAPWLDLIDQIPQRALRADLLAPVRRSLERPEHRENPRILLVIARLEDASSPSARAESVTRLTDRLKDIAPVELARFLEKLDLHSRISDVLPANVLKPHPEGIPLALDALRREENWNGITRLLDTLKEGVPPSVALRHRFLVAAKTQANSSAAAKWDAALDDATFSPDPDALLDLSRFARDAGLQEQADKAMVEALSRGQGRLPLHEEIKPLLVSLARQERESILLRICANYLQLEPTNPFLLTEYTYLASLNGLEDLATLVQAATRLDSDFPGVPPIQCTLAVTLVQAGRISEAAEIVGRIDGDPTKLTPGFHTVILLTRLLNHSIDQNDPLISAIPWNSLLPSERKTFKKWLQEAAR